MSIANAGVSNLGSHSKLKQNHQENFQFCELYQDRFCRRCNYSISLTISANFSNGYSKVFNIILVARHKPCFNQIYFTFFSQGKAESNPKPMSTFNIELFVSPLILVSIVDMTLIRYFPNGYYYIFPKTNATKNI